MDERKIEMEKIINTKRSTYGRILVTLPMDKKNQFMEWFRQSGLGKAEFFRVSLMIGSTQLATSIKANENSGIGNTVNASIALPDVRTTGN